MTLPKLMRHGLISKNLTFKETQLMKNFDLVTFLIQLAGRIQRKRHEKLVQREADLLAAIEATRNAYAATVEARCNANFRCQDIQRVS